MTNNMTMMTSVGKFRFFFYFLFFFYIQTRRSFRHKFRNFSVNIRFFLPLSILAKLAFNSSLFLLNRGIKNPFSFEGSTTSLTLVNFQLQF